MYCPKCGTRSDDQAIRCAKCGEMLQLPSETAFRSVEADLAYFVPLGVSGLAIAAMLVGLFAVLLVPAPVALLLGILAMRDIRRNPGKQGMGRALFGLVMGALGTVLLVMVGILLAVGG